MLSSRGSRPDSSTHYRVEYSRPDSPPPVMPAPSPVVQEWTGHQPGVGDELVQRPARGLGPERLDVGGSLSRHALLDQLPARGRRAALVRVDAAERDRDIGAVVRPPAPRGRRAPSTHFPPRRRRRTRRRSCARGSRSRPSRWFGCVGWPKNISPPRRGSRLSPGPGARSCCARRGRDVDRGQRVENDRARMRRTGMRDPELRLDARRPD